MGNTNNKNSLNGSVSLQHFKLLRTIGRGSFGKVRMVEHKRTGQKFALKYFSKDDLIKRKMAKNIIRERDILEKIVHPFICNLCHSFQDDYNLYMTLDLMLGGDLRFHSSRRKFSRDELVFITAEVGGALCYLHENGIVHRDIKPDNILLDSAGHAHLTDFNIASHIGHNKYLQSLSGTTQYMAPEMIQGLQYNHGVDWWSLGITLYECVAGKTPFYDSIRKSKKKLAIVNEDIEWPQHMFSSMGTDFFQFLQSLLVKEPSQRFPFSNANQLDSLQNHPLFSELDWELLHKKQLVPPFRPASNRSNFEAGFDLEELLLDDFPLESVPPRRTKSIKKMPEPMLYMEYSYKYYDASTVNRTSINMDSLPINNCPVSPIELPSPGSPCHATSPTLAQVSLYGSSFTLIRQSPTCTPEMLNAPEPPILPELTTNNNSHSFAPTKFLRRISKSFSHGFSLSPRDLNSNTKNIPTTSDVNPKQQPSSHNFLSSNRRTSSNSKLDSRPISTLATIEQSSTNWDHLPPLKENINNRRSLKTRASFLFRITPNSKFSPQSTIRPSCSAGNLKTSS